MLRRLLPLIHITNPAIKGLVCGIGISGATLALAVLLTAALDNFNAKTGLSVLAAGIHLAGHIEMARRAVAQQRGA
jgi:hypothetical protein